LNENPPSSLLQPKTNSPQKSAKISPAITQLFEELESALLPTATDSPLQIDPPPPDNLPAPVDADAPLPPALPLPDDPLPPSSEPAISETHPSDALGCPFLGIESDVQTLSDIAAIPNCCHRTARPHPVSLDIQASLCLTPGEGYRACPLFRDDPAGADALLEETIPPPERAAVPFQALVLIAAAAALLFFFCGPFVVAFFFSLP
jgi:hypothetical protein